VSPRRGNGQDVSVSSQYVRLGSESSHWRLGLFPTARVRSSKAAKLWNWVRRQVAIEDILEHRAPLDPRVGKIARNSVIALLAVILPAMVALFAIPVSLRVLGPESFGIISLTWIFLNYLTLTDLGMSKAIVLEFGSRADDAALPRIVGTSVLMTVMSSVFLAAATITWFPQYAARFFAQTPSQHDQISTVVAGALVALPLIAPSLSFRGALEALGEFSYVHSATAITGSIILLLPATAGVSGWSLTSVVIGMFVARSLLTVALAARLYCRIKRPLRSYASVRKDLARSMASFGGWVTAGDIVGPLITGAERVVVSAILGLQAVGFYSSVYEAVFRLAIIPAAISGALFPVLAGRYGDPEGRESTTSYDSARIYTAMGLAVIVVLFGALSPEGVQLWLDQQTSGIVEPVILWLLVAVMANGLARLPATLLHSARLSRPVSLTLVGELILCVPSLVLATRIFGLQGAAAVVALRGLVDLGVLHYLVHRSGIRVPGPSTRAAALIECSSVLSVGLMAAWARLESLPIRSGLAATSCAALVAAVARYRARG
jgi:O-antigen/teichoic acid export membrane protein